MALCYHSEYRLGPRGGRICRTYTGFHTFLAILIDLSLVLIFGSIALVFHLVRLALLALGRVALGVAQLVVRLMASPFRAARWVSKRVKPRTQVKPAWAGFEEL
jgi:hypothetical protein